MRLLKCTVEPDCLHKVRVCRGVTHESILQEHQVLVEPQDFALKYTGLTDFYLIGHQRGLRSCPLSLLLVGRNQIERVAHVVLQQPVEGLLLVPAKLERGSTQYQGHVGTITTLTGDYGLLLPPPLVLWPFVLFLGAPRL